MATFAALHPLYLALCQARLAHPGWAFPMTHYSPHAYVGAGGVFGAYLLAQRMPAGLKVVTG